MYIYNDAIGSIIFVNSIRIVPCGDKWTLCINEDRQIGEFDTKEIGIAVVESLMTMVKSRAPIIRESTILGKIRFYTGKLGVG